MLTSTPWKTLRIIYDKQAQLYLKSSEYISNKTPIVFRYVPLKIANVGIILYFIKQIAYVKRNIQ